MTYQWIYGTALSGLPVNLVTASGTSAVGYNATMLSTVISKDGTAWGSMSGRISSIPGDGVYTIGSITPTEMQCYFWAIQVKSNSGCIDRTITGYNLSGPVLNADISGIARIVNVSGLPGISTATSGIATLTAVSSAQYTILTAVSGVATLNAVSGIATLTSVSSIPGTLTAISSVGTYDGPGNTAVNHDTGGTDNLRYMSGGVGIDNATIHAYLKTNYDAGLRSSAYIIGQSTTNINGRWSSPIYLDTGNTYTIVFYKQGSYATSTAEITI
jgi:hypothetical protein